MCSKHQRCSLRNSRLIPKRVARANAETLPIQSVHLHSVSFEEGSRASRLATLMPDPMMVRLAVSTPDSPPLNSGSTQVIVQPSNNNSSSATNNSYVHQTDPLASQAATTTPPAQASISPTQQMAQNIPPGAIPLNQMSPHHMPPPFHHPHSGSNGAHLHDHSNGHHHNGLYLGPAYANEFYPAGADGAPTHGAYFIPQEMCPAHTQLCTVHPEYGENTLSIS